MDIFGVLSLIGGLALFLYGMHVMGAGLEKMSGGRLERILENLTSNPLKAVLLGAGVTAVIQSSSATTVMVVGFVNSGIMKLSQAIGIIMGANIGTTITAWLLSLTGIQGDNLFINMLKPTSFSPILALIGIILLMSGKSDKKKITGEILLGFVVLMYGMSAMSGAVEPLADVPEFTNLLTMFKNPVLGVLAGALLTAVIQSSSASVGTGAFGNRRIYIWHSDPDYSGTEHRYLCDGNALRNRCEQGCKAYRVCTFIFQHDRYGSFPVPVLSGECNLSFPVYERCRKCSGYCTGSQYF